MFLFIDTTTDKIILGLFKGDKLVDSLIKKAKYQQAELLLVLIDKFLKSNKISPKKISGLIVVKGPGSFTGTRIGVSVANALAFALEIPILGIKKENLPLSKIGQKYTSRVKRKKLIIPFYEKPPNITVKS